MNLVNCLTSHHGRNDASDAYIAHTLRAEGFDASEDGTGRGTPIVPIGFSMSSHPLGSEELCEPITNRHGDHGCVAYQCQGSNVGPMGALRVGNQNESGGVPFTISVHGTDDGKQVLQYRQDGLADTLRRDAGGATRSGAVAGTMGVRRLMPIECERLQGFPDDWTRYDADGKEIADSARYRMCGNAVAVPVAEYIARRLKEAAAPRPKELSDYV